jgi:hypothetical protein
MRVEKQSLGQLTLLSKGGFGEVFRIDGYHLPNDPEDLAYKQFTRDHVLQAQNAAAAVAFRDGLSPAEQADLDSHTVWPRALVEEPRGTVRGLLMPLIPAAFFRQMMDPDTGTLEDKPLEFSWLAAGAKQRLAAQLQLREIGWLERLVLLGKLIFAIGWLHKRGWVFGDVSFRNAVFTLDPPRTLLLDCDGAAPLSDLTRRQSTTPLWEPPELRAGTHNLQDTRTDVYKLGLAILRGMAPGKGAASDKSAARVAGVLDAEGAQLVADAVAQDPGRRPSARDLYDYFHRTVAAHTLPPEVTVARLRNPYRVRGQDVRIDWQIGNAIMVTVIAGNQRFQADPRQQPDGCVFRPDESGPVAIEVTNRLGALRVELGDVSLYELPPFKADVNFLPTPRIPQLPGLSMASLDAAIAAAPAAQLPAAPMVTPPDAFGLVESFTQPAMRAVPLPSFGEAVVDASAAITAALQGHAGN